MSLRITLVAGKGGVGKSTIASGIASVYAKQGKKTLLVDLDPQSNSTWGLGADPNLPGVAELLLNEKAEFQKVSQNLEVLSGGPKLNSHEITRMDPEELSDALDEVDYDYIIIDCPPALVHLERLGVVAGTVALVVIDAHPFSLQGAGRVVGDINTRRARKRTAPKKTGLVLSRIDLRRALDRELPAAAEEGFPGIEQLNVSQDTTLAQASTDRTPLAEYAPKSRGLACINEISKWCSKHGKA